MLLSTKLGHHQQYCCKFHCFQQDRAICQHLTIQGKNSTVSLGIKLTQKTLTTPVSIKWLCWNFMCGFLKGKAFKSTCTLWPEKKHYKHSNCNSSLPGDCKTQNREQHCTTCDCREKETISVPFVSDTSPHLQRYLCRLHLKCDGTRAETRFYLSAKRTSPFKSVGASVQLTTGSRGMRISGSNAGYTMFGGGVRVLATHSICQFPLHFPPMCHRVPSGFNWTLPSSYVT